MISWWQRLMRALDQSRIRLPRKPLSSREIQPGDWVLIDLWAKCDRPWGVYSDYTWTAFVGEEVPSRHSDIFNIVREAVAVSVFSSAVPLRPVAAQSGRIPAPGREGMVVSSHYLGSEVAAIVNPVGDLG